VLPSFTVLPLRGLLGNRAARVQDSQKYALLGQ
jgi:hypothetical protein